MTAAEVRRFALSLPEATEAPHFHYASFRVRGKIFATLPPEGDHLHLFVSEGEREIALSAAPGVLAPLEWGKRVVGLRVALAKAKPKLVHELLTQAWSFKAPRSLRPNRDRK